MKNFLKSNKHVPFTWILSNNNSKNRERRLKMASKNLNYWIERDTYEQSLYYMWIYIKFSLIIVKSFLRFVFHFRTKIFALFASSAKRNFHPVAERSEAWRLHFPQLLCNFFFNRYFRNHGSEVTVVLKICMKENQQLVVYLRMRQWT